MNESFNEKVTSILLAICLLRATEQDAASVAR